MNRSQTKTSSAATTKMSDRGVKIPRMPVVSGRPNSGSGDEIGCEFVSSRASEAKISSVARVATSELILKTTTIVALITPMTTPTSTPAMAAGTFPIIGWRAIIEMPDIDMIEPIDRSICPAMSTGVMPIASRPTIVARLSTDWIVVSVKKSSIVMLPSTITTISRMTRR